jgi:hypothetical protein
VHRIISADPAGYTMQGDANSYQDPWQPRASNVVGRIVVTLPGLGASLSSLANPFVLAAVWGLAALVLGLSFLPQAPGQKSDRPSNPTIRRRSRLGPADAVVVLAVLASGLMTALVALNTVLMVYPAWNLGAVGFSLACATAITTVGLFMLPESPLQAPGEMWTRWSPIRIRAGHSMLKTTSVWAMSILIGLVMVSAYVTISPAHAAGLNARSETLTAQVHKSKAYSIPRLGPPVTQGPPPSSGPPSIAPNGVPARPIWPSGRR